MVPLFLIVLGSLSCSFSDKDPVLDAARDEFHRRWAAGQFHEIYMNSTDGESRPESESGWTKNWARSRRDYGSFTRDTQDFGTHGFEGSGSGYGKGYTSEFERYYNTEYSGTRMPIVEKFQWRFKDDGTVRLAGFGVQPNAEVRCSYRVMNSANVCDVTMLGPVPGTPPM